MNDRKYVKIVVARSRIDEIVRKEKAIELYIRNELHVDIDYIKPHGKYIKMKNDIIAIRKIK